MLSDIGQLITQRDKTVVCAVDKEIMLLKELYSNKKVGLYVEEDKGLVRV